MWNSSTGLWWRIPGVSLTISRTASTTLKHKKLLQYSLQIFFLHMHHINITGVFANTSTAVAYHSLWQSVQTMLEHCASVSLTERWRFALVECSLTWLPQSCVTTDALCHSRSRQWGWHWQRRMALGEWANANATVIIHLGRSIWEKNLQKTNNTTRCTSEQKPSCEQMWATTIFSDSQLSIVFFKQICLCLLPKYCYIDKIFFCVKINKY